MPEAIVRELWTYPVKACQGIAAESIEIGPMGVVGDREFVLWSEGALVDQKETPRIAALAAGYDRSAGTLRFEHATCGSLVHEIRAEGAMRDTKWILDEFQTVDQGDEVAAWLSAAIDKDVRLVSPGPEWKINFPIPAFEPLHRAPKQRFFAASPISLANQASLDDLNARLAEPVGMDRFRMNVVVDGLAPYQEDDLAIFESDEVSIRNVTAAERCIIINTNQKTGERAKSDVLKVLGSVRRKPAEKRFGSGITFGLYMTVERSGTLRVGDRLQVT